MTLKPLHGVFVALALAPAAPSAIAADWLAAMHRGDLGSPYRAAAQRTVKMTAATKYITVEHFQTVKIEKDKGQSFVWRFDRLGEYGFPLSVIGPKGFAAGDTSVLHPPPGGTHTGRLIAVRTRDATNDKF